MNEFINDALNYDELDELEKTILHLDTFKDFLNKINVTYGCYRDNTEKYCVFIKCKDNSYNLFVVFGVNDKFESIYKSYDVFETWAGRVLLYQFHSARCDELNIHWGEHVLDLGNKKESNKNECI